MLRIGMLNVRNDQLTFRPLDKQPYHNVIHIAPGSAFEIQLGGVWIPGELHVSSALGRSTELHFVAKEGSRCGLVAGMVARLFLEGDSEAASREEGEEMSDDALAWDDRGSFAGVENEHFMKPPREIIEYARSHGLRMNLWSHVVQQAIQVRIQMENNGQKLPPFNPEENWLPWR